MSDTRQRFQGKCFVALEGKDFMYVYDNMPTSVRERLKNSPFNICPACVMTEFDGNYSEAIDKIEAAILAELGPFGPR